MPQSNKKKKVETPDLSENLMELFEDAGFELIDETPWKQSKRSQ